MSNTLKNPDDEQVAAGSNDIEKLVEAWASSKEGAEKLRAVQQSAKAAADFVDSEIRIDPQILHQSVTL